MKRRFKCVQAGQQRWRRMRGLLIILALTFILGKIQFSGRIDRSPFNDNFDLNFKILTLLYC